MSCPTDRDERSGQDRRHRPTRPWDILRTPGRRWQYRRAEDRGPRNLYRDRHGASDRLFAILLLVLTLVDGCLTIVLVEPHYEEANPFLAPILARSPAGFFAVKYLLTAGGVVALMVLRDCRICRGRFPVGRLVPILVGLYLLLLIYQCSLLHGEWTGADLIRGRIDLGHLAGG